MHAIFIGIILAVSQCTQHCMARQEQAQRCIVSIVTTLIWLSALLVYTCQFFSFDLTFYILREQLVSALTLNFSHKYGICILITSFITIKYDPLRVFLCHLPFRMVCFGFVSAFIFFFLLSSLCSPGSENFNSLRLLRAIDFSFFHADCFSSCLTDSSVRFIGYFIICLSLWIHS